MFLGVRGRSGEFIVGNIAGLWKARSVQRKPVGDRWNSESANMVKHVPWRMLDDDPNVDGEPLEVVKLSP